MEPTDQATSPSFGPDASAAVARRARPARILITAVLAEIVVIAGACNQGVVSTITKHLNDGTRDYADYSRGAIEAVAAFGWRFAPASGQATHVWAAQFAGIGTLLVLTAVGVLFVARGVVTFGRVFVAIWALVAAVAPIAIMVRNIVVVPNKPGPLQSRVGQSVYGYPDFGSVIVAGVALGLVVGLIAATVGVLTRTRPGGAGRDVTGDEDGEYLDTTFAPGGGAPTTAYEPPPWGVEPPMEYTPFERPPAERAPMDWPAPNQAPFDQPTAQQPAVRQPAADQPTAQQPAVRQPAADQPGAQQPSRPAPAARQPVVEPGPARPLADQPTAVQPSYPPAGGQSPPWGEPRRPWQDATQQQAAVDEPEPSSPDDTTQIPPVTDEKDADSR